MVSKIVNDSDAQHEIDISNLVKKIKNYQDHFLPVENHCNVKQKLPIVKCDAIKHHTKYKILYIPYKETMPTNYDFKQLYHALLQSLQLLIQHKLVHFDIKQGNIILSDKVFILDFNLSISMKNVMVNLENAFYKFQPSYYYWPLEVHLLCYRINHGPVTLPRLTHICNEFVKHHSMLQKLSPRFIKEYTEGSIAHFTTILELSSKEFIKACIQYWKTWDNYATIIYLFEEGYAIPPMFLKNIHYLPKERLSVTKCLTATSAS
jgi:serine/threonine protein kinase